MLELTGEKIFVLHFPTKSKYRCFAFKYTHPCEANGNKPSLWLTFQQWQGEIGGEKTPWGCIHYSDVSAIDYGTEFEIHSRLLSSLGMYLSCFPEMLKDGPPNDVKHPSYHKYADAKTIGISPQVPASIPNTAKSRRTSAGDTSAFCVQSNSQRSGFRLCSSSSAS